MAEFALQYCGICHQFHHEGKHVTLDQMEKNYILQVYEAKNRNILQTAATLQIARYTLQLRLSRYGVRP